MKLTAVFEPAKEGEYSCFVEEVPAAISQGETLAEAKANLLDALELVLECQRELAEKGALTERRARASRIRRGMKLRERRLARPVYRRTRIPMRQAPLGAA